jgi:hypothetical protein
LTEAKKKAKEEAYKLKADNIKDYTNLVVNNGMNAAKDKTKSLTMENEKDIKKKIEYLFEDTVRDWQQSLVTMNKAVFAGDEKGIEVLTKLIRSGNSINRTVADSLEVQDQATKFLVSVMVPPLLFGMRFLLTNGGSAKNGIDNICHGNTNTPLTMP